MLRSKLIIPTKVYKCVIQHLLPRDSEHEEVAFVFADVLRGTDELKVEHKEWYAVPPDGFLVRSLGYIELTDETRASVIKRAHDLNATLVELHSHPYQSKARFSPSDLEGLKEFVPHVIWRLKDRPYVAVVVTPTGFDALIWLSSSNRPVGLSELQVGRRTLRPTGLTLLQELNL